MHGKAVVVGVGETTYYKHGQSPDTEFQLACQAIERACADAGIDLSQVDGLISYMDARNSPLRIAGALGMKELRGSSTPWAGGGNNSASCVMQADAAVAGQGLGHIDADRHHRQPVTDAEARSIFDGILEAVEGIAEVEERCHGEIQRQIAHDFD